MRIIKGNIIKEEVVGFLFFIYVKKILLFLEKISFSPLTNGKFGAIIMILNINKKEKGVNI